MPQYQAPLRDMHFLLRDCADPLSQNLPGFEAFNAEMSEAVLGEAAKFLENEVFPLNQSGDQQGCRLESETVRTPDGWPEVYQHYVQSGWGSLPGDSNYGGQGCPHQVNVFVEEMLCSANVSFHLYTNLTQGVARTIGHHAPDALKKIVLPPMIQGSWTGAMCLTEAHCGSDLGLVRTEAKPLEDGTYRVSGTKIFITGGDHDLSENIIHIVLARTPNAPPGVKGLSVFLVPKYLWQADGSLGERNGMSCSSLEHKMGLRGSATCVMNYDEAQGYLIGELHQGLATMFTAMNTERLAIGLQGLGLAEVAYQNALSYAQERLQGRAQPEPVQPEKSADPILVHPDVRRMLLLMKSQTEGARALAFWIAGLVDQSTHHPDESVRAKAEILLDLFTPVVKAFFTDHGTDACHLAVQVLGGHGYISEWGIEQYLRDARVAQLYEGTNGIQALDLLRRKLLGDQGQGIHAFMALAEEATDSLSDPTPLITAVKHLRESSEHLLTLGDTPASRAAAVDYLRLLALVGLGHQWARMMGVATQAEGTETSDFYTNKLATAEFFFQWVLPETALLAQRIQQGTASVLGLSLEAF